MRPFFVIGPPRSGTTLMHDLLALHPDVSAHAEDFHPFHHNLMRFRHRAGSDDHFRLTTADTSPELVAEYRAAVEKAAGNRGVFLLKISTLSMQVDFVRALLPEARFIQLVRDARDATCSMEDLRQAIERDQGHERVLGPAPDPFGLWCAEQFDDKHLRAAATWYYHVTRSALDLGFAGGDACLRLRYEDFIANPRATVERVLGFMELDTPKGVDQELGAVTDRPGAPGGLGFSTSQASGARRVGRFEEELSSDLRVAIAPLLETPMMLLGYQADPSQPGERYAAACAALGIDDRWTERVQREVDWYALHRRVFSPENALRQNDRPTPESQPLLVDSAVVGHSTHVGDGARQGGISWVAKQSRRHTFFDPDRTILEVADRLDGHNTVSELGLGDEACAVLEQLAGQGFVGYA